MATADYRLAPPPTMVDGLLAVPVHFHNVQGTVRFDGAPATGRADGTVTYEVGPTTGSPLFDLRQAIELARVRHERTSIRQCAACLPHPVGTATTCQQTGMQAPGNTAAHTTDAPPRIAVTVAPLGALLVIVTAVTLAVFKP
jgi:hypothetical protein